MNTGPPLDKRIIKQSLYMGLLVYASLSSARFLGLSRKILTPLISIIGIGMFFDWISIKITHKAHKGILALDNLVRLPLRLYLQHKVGVLSLNRNNDAYLPMHLQWILTAIISDNFKSIIRYLKSLSNGFSSFSDTLSLSDGTEDEDDLATKKSLLKASVSKIAIKAQLNQINLEIQNSAIMNAYTHYYTNTVTLNSGLIASLKQRKLIDAAIAHEIGHLLRSHFDKTIFLGSLLAYRLLYAMGFIKLLETQSNRTQGFLHTLGLFGLANLGYCGVLQAEEERADRKSCHLLDNPYQALAFQLTFNRKKRRIHQASYGSTPAELVLKNITTTLKFSNHYLVDFCRKIAGIGTHPSSQYRMDAIKDEINKIELN